MWYPNAQPFDFEPRACTTKQHVPGSAYALGLYLSFHILHRKPSVRLPNFCRIEGRLLEYGVQMQKQRNRCAGKLQTLKGFH